MNETIYRKRQLINDSYVLILFINENKRFEIGYEDVVDDIAKPFHRIRKMIKDDQQSASDILYYIKDYPQLKFLFSHFNYCTRLSGSFQNLNSDIEKELLKYPQIITIEVNNKKNIDNNKKELLDDLIERWRALSLDDTYDLCDKKIKSGKIVVYSHRKRGWSAPAFKLNENFSLEILTNFGYGKSSYFYTKLTYKGIQIVPFSEWVLYEWANFYDIIRYSSKHNLDDESWFESFEYARDACNLALDDETRFVENYILDECEKMVSGLESFLEGEEFEFIDSENGLTKVIKSGHQLIEFRGEKITGALDFIQNILSLNHIAVVENFIERIEKSNNTLISMLKKELRLINVELYPLEQKKMKLLQLYNQLSNQYHYYDSLKVNLNKKIMEENDNRLINIDVIFDVLYPQYENIKQKYFQLNLTVNEINDQIKTLNNIKNNINSYLDKIDSYFKSRIIIQEKDN